MTQTNPHLRNITFNETFESSLIEKNNEKFTVDKSLIKGIKQNDVSKIIDQNELRSGEENQQIFDELREIEAIVIDTRKRYDEVKTTAVRHEQNIDKLKKQKDLLLEQENKYNEIINKQRRDLDDTERKRQEMIELMESTLYQKDIYLNVKDVVKNDLLVLKKRYFDSDVRLMRDSTKLRSLRTEHESKMKLSKRCREVLESVERSVTIKHLERTTKIQSFCDVLNRKQANKQNRQIREREIEEAMVSAMTDKLAEEKQWGKIFNANLFLKGMLKSKMERLMNKYQKIELSFHKMKQATSIKDSSEFITRFLNREETYGLLLESISDKERQLEEIKQERDELQKVHNSFLYKSEEIMEQKKKVDPRKLEQSNPSNVLQQLNQRVLAITRQQQLMYQWAIKFILGYTNQKREDVLRKFPKTKKKYLFVEVFSCIKGFMNELAAQENRDKKIEQAFMQNNPREKFLSSETLERNTRVKTLSAFENYEMGSDAFEDRDLAYDDLSEADYLQYNRRAIKKSDIQNRKFRIKTKPN